jgi:hypothetical protein
MTVAPAGTLADRSANPAIALSLSSPTDFIFP